MSRQINCVYPDGASFQATVPEARWIVASDVGEWDKNVKRTVRMKRECRAGGKLSLRVGAPLAVAAQRGEGWARVAVTETRKP